MLSLEQIFIPNKKAAFRNIGKKMVIVHAQDQRMITLNESGTAVWERLDGRPMLAIAEDFAQLFGITPKQAGEDILAFVEVLLQKDLVCRVET